MSEQQAYEKGVRAVIRCLEGQPIDWRVINEIHALVGEKPTIGQKPIVSEPDNHHNALVCLYCNPNGSLIERADVIRRARQQADEFPAGYPGPSAKRVLRDFAASLEALEGVGRGEQPCVCGHARLEHEAEPSGSCRYEAPNLHEVAGDLEVCDCRAFQAALGEQGEPRG